MNISESVHDLLSRTEIVADLFYDIFLDRYPEVQQYFVGVDLKQQALVLTMVLSIVEEYYRHGYPATARYLALVGRKHMARRIPSNLYPKFADCLVETLQRFHGANWSADLEHQWREALDRAIKAMLEGYR